jgi:hypothetical protein
LAFSGCGGGKPPIVDAREHVPHTAEDEAQNPFQGTAELGEAESFFSEYNYQRFGKGLRMGMTEAELVRLAEVPARKRLTGERVGEEEFTFLWDREPTGFRVLMRDGRAIGWMSERAVLLEPERMRP